METKTPIQQDSTYIFGLIIFVLSFASFLFTMNEFQNTDFLEGVFFLNYFIFFIYFIRVGTANWSNYGKFWRFRNMRHNIVLLLLANISAYALNRSITVFQMSSEWVSAFLVILNVAMIIFSFREKRTGDVLNYILTAILAAGLLFNIYQSIYVLPLYLVTGMTFWFFGISLHTFVPICFVILLFKMLKKYTNVSPDYWRSIFAGIAIPMGFLFFTVSKWNGINHTINEVYHASQAAYANDDLPNWVQVSQQLKQNWFTERALKSNIVYSTFDEGSVNNLFWPRNFGFNEKAKHDPFIMVTTFLVGQIDLSYSEKIKILKAIHNQRHQTERRLWSGDNLSTDDIVTNVQLFPAYRLAYTEKTFSIKNDGKRNGWRWNNTQEALYSFNLPEASVVTSASLWVDGVERKSFLTTKTKADSAYTTIVGRERRDPLLLHWQEGNRITVRVFPCTPQANRKFKIGVTTPLKFENGQLTYENIDFVGPDWKAANESINIVNEGVIGELNSNLSLHSKGTAWNYMGQYKSDWTLQFDAVPLAQDAFSFNGKSYQLKEVNNSTITFDAKDVYLDINAAWSKSEFKKIWKAIKDKKVWVYTNRLERMDDKNKGRLFSYLQNQNYSLFPFHKIIQPAQALVITKANRLTPTLADLKDSKFSKQLNDYMQANTIVPMVYRIGEGTSPYLKMLKELRLYQEENGSVEQLLDFVSNNKFPKNLEDEKTISLDDANMLLQRSNNTINTKSHAPDHLMRLFAYNDLMKKMGRDYFQKDQLADQLVGAAEEAYVVTPISSLIVLETQKDYDRFDIKQSKNSLKNASIKSSGAVPEPHEWLLIILAACFAFYLHAKFAKGAKFI